MSHPSATSNMTSESSTAGFDLNECQDAVSLALDHAKSLGASAAEAGVSAHQGLAVTVRLGEVETLEHNRDRTLSISLYNGQRKGSASCGDIRSNTIRDAVAHAWAIATHTEADPSAGLADSSEMATVFPELDLWHPKNLTADDLIERAMSIEQAGLNSDSRIRNSEGAIASSSSALGVYGNSHGFMGTQQGTSFDQSAVLVAAETESTDAMQSNYSWDRKRQFSALQNPEETGREAAERTLRRLGAKPIKTTKAPILFTAEAANSLVGHMVSAVSGGALYRKNSFLLDCVGKSIFPSFINISENPHERCGINSSGFDSDGVATGLNNELITDGVLQRYVLSTYSARRLGLVCTGNAGGVRNLKVQSGESSFDDLVAQMNTGLIVTDVMGQGVNSATGNYSRGVSGFWVENGEIVQPVAEVTIAGNLLEMYANIVALGNDPDLRRNQQTPSWLLAPMTIAGN